MKIIEKPYYVRPPELQREMDTIASHLMATHTFKPRLKTPEGMTDAEFILSLQTQSTRDTLMRTDEEQAAWLKRPLPENWLAVKDAKNMDEAVAARPASVQEMNLIESMRRAQKNTQGQSEKSSVSEESRAHAIEAFIFTPPAKVTAAEVESRAVGLVQYKSEPKQEVWVELPWYKAFIHWLKGNEVRKG